MKKISFIIILLSLWAVCGKGETTMAGRREEQPSKDTTPKQLVEIFVDSIHIGESGNWKIELRQMNNNIGASVNFSLFVKERGNWIKRQSGSFSKPDEIGMLPEMRDLNGDGLNDICIKYERSGNGANDIRIWYIFNHQKMQLKRVIASERYSNLAYNPMLKTIDAVAIYGNSSTTTFMQLVNDKLKKIGKVTFDGTTIASYNIKNGKEQLLKKVAYKGEPVPYIRFTNFNPIQK